MAIRVLLVDDELHILRAAEYKLKSEGFHVVCASDGESAWEQIDAAQPDVLVTDQQMPRLNGTALVARLRQHPDYAELPVILLTAKGIELAHEEAVHALGIIEIVPKPFSPRDLCRRVAAAAGAKLGGRCDVPVTTEA
jgi:DNA-binding response OmpR family regulator